MNKAILSLVAIFLVGAVEVAEAQQPKKIPRVGYVTLGSSSPPSANQERFRLGLRQLGYIEGQNIHVEYRYAEGAVERLPELVAELVGLKVDVLLAANTQTIDVARRASKTIPIVFPVTFDPVASGFVESRSTGWKPHGFDHTEPGGSGKTRRAAQGGLTEDFPCGRA